jgi:hypothetical protein
MSSVEAEERLTGSRFDSILKSRIDLFWYDSFPKHLDFVDTTYHAEFSRYRGAPLDARPSDHFFVLPRRVSPAILDLSTRYRQDCAQGRTQVFQGVDLETVVLHVSQGACDKAVPKCKASRLHFPFVAIRAQGAPGDTEAVQARWCNNYWEVEGGHKTCMSEASRVRECTVRE